MPGSFTQECNVDYRELENLRGRNVSLAVHVHQHLSPIRLIVDLIRWIVDKTKEPIISAILPIARSMRTSSITVFNVGFPFIKHQFEENRWYSLVPLLRTIYDYYNGVIDSNYPDRMKKVNSVVAVCQQRAPAPDFLSVGSRRQGRIEGGFPGARSRRMRTRIAWWRFINNGISGRMVSLCLIIQRSLKGMFEFAF